MLVEARRTSALALAGVLELEIPASIEAISPLASIDMDQAITLTAGWALVHALATLLVDDRLSTIVGACHPSKDTKALVTATIDRIQLVLDEEVPRDRLSEK